MLVDTNGVKRVKNIDQTSYLLNEKILVNNTQTFWFSMVENFVSMLNLTE